MHTAIPGGIHRKNNKWNLKEQTRYTNWLILEHTVNYIDQTTEENKSIVEKTPRGHPVKKKTTPPTLEEERKGAKSLEGQDEEGPYVPEEGGGEGEHEEGDEEVLVDPGPGHLQRPACIPPSL